MQSYILYYLIQTMLR